MSGWNNADTAKVYEHYAQTHATYRDTSHDLVRLAGISAGMQVVDVCCGTGITSEATLKILGKSGRLDSVDLSAAMLTVAREKLRADTVHFHESPAEKLHEIIHTPVDRVVCNSAFWQVDADATLQSIHKILKPDGCFAFNLPVGFYDLPDDDTDDEDEPNIRAMMREIAEREYGYTFPPHQSIIRWHLNYESVVQKLDDNGFVLHHYEVLSYQESNETLIDFYKIPVMTERNLPTVDYETRMEILGKIRETLNPEHEFTDKWAYFVCQKKND